MASTYLTKSFASSGNRKKFTFSMWVKRGNITNSFCMFNQHYSSNNNNSYIGFNSDDTLSFWSYSGSYQMNLKTSAKYRDTNGWYHIVCVADTEQATSSNRAKLYVNGVEPTLGTATYPSQNQDLNFNSDETQQIGVYRYGSTNNYFYDGCISHFHFCDGYAYAASDFGQTDATTGEWSIKTSPSVSYGTNGYWILKDGNSVTDQSPNTNNWNVQAGSLTKSEDCPSNVFATLDKLQRKTSACTYTNGNTTVSFPGAWVLALGNMGVSSGKWYWEAKCNSGNNSNSYYGICAEMVPTGNGFYNNSQNGAIMIGVGSNGDTYIDGSYTSGGTSPVNNNTDILSLALDLDSGTKTLKIYKNGTLLSTNGTINLSSYYNDTLVFPCFSGNTSSASASFNVNFGNGYFGTTAVSSAGTNASNNGIFEYDVPSGYTALSTKGLNL